MSDYFKYKDQELVHLLLAQVIIKLAAMEKLLIKSGAISADDLVLEMQSMSDEVVNIVAKYDLSSVPSKGN